MSKILIKDAQVVNEGKVFTASVLVENQYITQVLHQAPAHFGGQIIEAKGLHLFPGCIDYQVHFREPGLTHKGDLTTESRAAIAGGITSFMEMPNTVPNTLTIDLLEAKYQRAAACSLANYSFFMGASNDNLSEVLKADPKSVCGVKVFMGSSTGNMLVDNPNTLEQLFAQSPMLIAVHCEDEATIKQNLAEYKSKYGDNIPVEAHPLIRNAEACYKSSSLAVSLAKKHNTRLHILHISTAKELSLFDNTLPLQQKRITSEACIHHLWFSDQDYANKGNFIKWNPAIKSGADRSAILQALLDGKIDVVATDHAPHTLAEKQQPYTSAPSGGPLVQHALVAMLEMAHQQKITLPLIAHKMAHAVAECFQIEKRGYIRPGYFADLVLVDLNAPWTVDKSNLLYKCGWSPFEGTTFQSKVTHTFVNGHLAYQNGQLNESHLGQRLSFSR